MLFNFGGVSFLRCKPMPLVRLETQATSKTERHGAKAK
jgi:hypothetical protein